MMLIDDRPRGDPMITPMVSSHHVILPLPLGIPSTHRISADQVETRA